MTRTSFTPNAAAPESPNAGSAKTSDRAPAPSLLLIVGSLLAVIGLVWVGRTARFVRHAVRVPGQVLRIERRQSRNTTGHFPVFTFTDPSGVIRTQRSSSGFGVSFLGPGKKVMVLCDPAAPEDARIESFMSAWFEPLGLTAFALVMAGTGAFRLRRARQAAGRAKAKLVA